MYFSSHYDKVTKEPLKGSNSYFWLMILMDIHHFGGKVWWSVQLVGAYSVLVYTWRTRKQRGQGTGY